MCEAVYGDCDHGYVDTVEMALDHGEMAREPMIALLQAVYARRPRAYLVECLALGYGVLPAAPEWPVVLIAGARAWVITRDYAARRLWTVQWLFFAGPVRLAVDQELLAVLLAAGVLLGEQEVVLEPQKIGHVGFPELPGTQRVVVSPLGDASPAAMATLAESRAQLAGEHEALSASAPAPRTRWAGPSRGCRSWPRSRRQRGSNRRACW